MLQYLHGVMDRRAGARSLGVEMIYVVAGRGYFKIEDVETCEKDVCVPDVPRPQPGSSVREGFCHKDELQYDAGHDVHVCRAGTLLTPTRNGRSRSRKDRLRQPESLPRLPAARAMRDDARLEIEAVLDGMAERLRTRPNSRASRRGRRPSIRQHQAVDV